ncbi:GNAT family N-acetyltransferase [Streptomyces sp. NPDC050416]|uniref:GNAT family N-acetyltransferase n=1 Tax=Streptomyces sp. NPDC050416 TaxID=3365611 RepID=UPI00379CEC93
MRSATEEDLPSLAQLDRDVFGDAAYPFFVLRQLFDVGHTLVAAQDGDELCAYALASVKGGEGWLLSLAVAPRHRGHGVGRSLLLHMLLHLRSRLVRKVVLTVEPSNTTAMTLYQSLGFTCEDAPREDYFGPGESRLLMTLSL